MGLAEDLQAGQVPDLPATMSVEVAVGIAPREVRRVTVQLPAGSTVRCALDAAGVWAWCEGLQPEAVSSGGWSIGVWGRKERLGHVLRDRDRIELVRPLIVDPKEARRVRYRAQGEKLPKGIHRPKQR